VVCAQVSYCPLNHNSDELREPTEFSARDVGHGDGGSGSSDGVCELKNEHALRLELWPCSGGEAPGVRK
jgi:hypothetical protein